ncbi:hypothetical protein P168DRAFT_320679 [Aspergillus campestris IBT 28561]|uniref:F-box domain-containing protein n=1 Tax=Aspergillus campestris (strain IBT 28561) TaxID=1392248 RepID=A0A2I1CWW8_ASPC2|nr:uncharacterized protein P168DRAFT_320679 [Aspergillus campestris IBT 28561]PKY02118.1 hypothetical protein P168DRAFT_320679 [Aspergillus campestris IBT 28561]
MVLPIYLWCMLCGGVIDQAGNRLVEGAQPVNDAHGYRLVDAAALEDNYLLNEEHQWCGFHRIITHVPDTDIYYLSGIGYQAYTKQCGLSCFRVPIDPTKAVIGLVEPGVDGFQVHNCSYIPPTADGHAPGANIGFPIHMRCWSLAKIKLGPAVEQNLGLFWTVLRDRFVRLIGKLGLPTPITSLEPYKIPGIVQTLSQNFARTTVSPSASTFPSRLSCLPQEIYWPILDCLDWQSFVNLKKAVAWPSMGGYWRCRAALLLDEDLDPIPGPELDWEAICLELERLDEVDGVFCNRRRILRVLKDFQVNMQQLITRQVDVS